MSNYTIYDKFSEDTTQLRYLRYKIPRETLKGKEIVRLYYQWSSAIVKAIKEDDEFKEEVKEMIDGVLQTIRGKVK